jgi:hypothetical protein
MAAAAHPKTEAPATASAATEFHDLFRAVGLSETIQVDRVVAHATIAILDSFTEPLVSIADQEDLVVSVAPQGPIVSQVGATDVGASLAVVPPGKAFPLFDLAARQVLFDFFQANPNAQAVFYDGNALVFDADDQLLSGPVTLRVWEFEDGGLITLVGQVDDLAQAA